MFLNKEVKIVVCESFEEFELICEINNKGYKVKEIIINSQKEKPSQLYFSNINGFEIQFIKNSD